MTVMNPLEGWLLPRATRVARPRVVVLGGDGIGPEVTSAAVACLRALEAPLELVEPLHGEAAVRQNAPAFPPGLKEVIQGSDAVLYGASGGTSNDILRYLRFHLECYANLRPTHSWPVIPARTGGGGTNLVIVRELTEGLYPAREGNMEDLVTRWPELRDRLGRELPRDGRFALRVVTERATTRIARYAAQLAAHRRSTGCGSGKVTVVTKRNVLAQTDGLFLEVAGRELGQAGIEFDELYVDEAARRLVARPESFDVVLTTNLFGDILSDVAAEGMGGMPMSPSAGIGDQNAYFEPVHGSAPDIEGKGIANPLGSVTSAAMMLVYLGLPREAERLHQAMLDVLSAGIAPRDLGGKADTGELTQALVDRLQAR